MKILILLIFTSLCACSEQDASPKDNSVTGTWNVIKIEGGFAPVETYKLGEILWEFKTNDSLIIITNTTLPNNSRIPFKASTVYSFRNDSISIEDVKYECHFDNNHLILLDQFESDGLRLELTKMK